MRVNQTLTVFLLARVVPYSSGVQQPMRATAIVGSHPHTGCAAPFEREQVVPTVCIHMVLAESEACRLSLWRPRCSRIWY